MPEDADRETLNKWVDEEFKYCIYDEPLGADERVYEFWSSIARSLGLQIITKIYNHGLHTQDKNELQALEQELNQLSQYWKTHNLKESGPFALSHDELMYHLWERMEYFHKAIQIAKENNADLDIQ